MSIDKLCYLIMEREKVNRDRRRILCQAQRISQEAFIIRDSIDLDMTHRRFSYWAKKLGSLSRKEKSRRAKVAKYSKQLKKMCKPISKLAKELGVRLKWDDNWNIRWIELNRETHRCMYGNDMWLNAKRYEMELSIERAIRAAQQSKERGSA